MKPAAANGSQRLDPTLPTRMTVAASFPERSRGTPSSGPGWNPPRTARPAPSTAAAIVSYTVPAPTHDAGLGPLGQESQRLRRR